MPILQSERLILRPFDDTVVDEMHRLWTDPIVRKHLWDNTVIPRDRASAVIGEAVRLGENSGIGMWSIHLPASQAQVAGFCGLRWIGQSRDVEILYGLAPHYHGHGFATEASRAVLNYAFNELHLPRVYAGADPANASSVRVMIRLGMSPLDVPHPEDPSTTFYFLDRE